MSILICNVYLARKQSPKQNGIQKILTAKLWASPRTFPFPLPFVYNELTTGCSFNYQQQWTEKY